VIFKFFIISQKLIDDLRLFCFLPNAGIPFGDNIVVVAEDNEDDISGEEVVDIHEFYSLFQLKIL
jgi:hypothetical protein